MKKTGLWLILFVLVSCSGKDKTQLHILFKNANGLNTGNPVFCNGVEIGSVHRINLVHHHQPLVTIRLNDDIKIPKGSSFTAGYNGMLTRSIIIQNSNSKTYYRNNDTIIGEELPPLKDRIKKELRSFSDSSVAAKTQSILDTFKKKAPKLFKVLKNIGNDLPPADRFEQPDEKTRNAAIDLVAKLDVVKKEMAMVEKLSKGKRHLSFMVLNNDAKNGLYDVMVAEDNGHNLVNHFVFLVNLKTKTVVDPDGKMLNE